MTIQYYLLFLLTIVIIGHCLRLRHLLLSWPCCDIRVLLCVWWGYYNVLLYDDWYCIDVFLLCDWYSLHSDDTMPVLRRCILFYWPDTIIIPDDYSLYCIGVFVLYYCWLLPIILIVYWLFIVFRYWILLLLFDDIIYSILMTVFIQCLTYSLLLLNQWRPYYYWRTTVTILTVLLPVLKKEADIDIDWLR